MKNLTCFTLFSVTILGSSASGFLCLSLLDASCKSLMLLAIATVASLALVQASAATRHLVWAATVIGLLLMPACALLLPEWRVLPSWLSLERRFEQTIATNDTTVPLMPTSDVKIESQLAPSIANTLPTTVVSPPPLEKASVDRTIVEGPIRVRLNAGLLLEIWTAGCLFCLLPIVVGYLRLQRTERMLKNNPPLSKHLARRIGALSTQLGIAVPRILVGPEGSMPMVWSFGHSRLLLPADSEQWSMSRVKSVLLHELVHLKRRDPTWFLIGLVARAVNWFNPLAWVALHRLRLECERACDDHVLRMGVDSSEYASHLLALSTSVRAGAGTGFLALAMATKPNVENRIVSILNEKMNRRGVTIRWTAGTLFAVSACVAIMATLAATAADKTITDFQDDKVAIKYPYCVVEVENLKSRSLAEAVFSFNKEAKESPTGVTQPPITEQETLSSMSEFEKLVHVDEVTKATLREVVETKTLPPNVYFRRFTRFDDEQQMHGVWWVRLCVDNSGKQFYSIPIRTTSIFSRPYTQMERKQNTEGITLLNRFSSYFEAPPSIGLKEEIPQEPIDRLKESLLKSIHDKDLEGINKLFHWEGASDSTRDFVISEMRMLLNRTTLSIKFEPKTLNGKLIHWSAYQNYEPNLPVDGYLNVEYIVQAPTTPYLLDVGDILAVYIEGVLPKVPGTRIPSEGGYPIVVQENGTIALPAIEPILVEEKSVAQVKKMIKTAYLDAKIFNLPERLNPLVSLLKPRSSVPKKILSLEVGKIGNEFRIVNYVPSGERKLPEGIIEALSMRSNRERLADVSYLLTTVVTNPGPLISAHLANEEIRSRGSGNKKRIETNSAKDFTESIDIKKDRVESEAKKMSIDINKTRVKWEAKKIELEAEVHRIKQERLELKKRMEQIIETQSESYIQGKVVEVGSGDPVLVWINLGKADGLRLGVSFDVSGDHKAATGKPKAKIEVVEIVAEHLSRCKVVSTVGAQEILMGDSIYSPFWQVGRQTKFAFIGKMDLDGDGKDDRETLMLIIIRNGGRIGFDMPPSGEITGELTDDTRWLILGEGVDAIDGAELIQSKAKELGISQIRLEKLMDYLRIQKRSP